jgi:succinate dehydrogenase/fumarate reductase cytochrome b subunit
MLICGIVFEHFCEGGGCVREFFWAAGSVKGRPGRDHVRIVVFVISLFVTFLLGKAAPIVVTGLDVKPQLE